jgi:hypothetical protein
MRQKSNQGAVRPKKMKNLVFYRNHQLFLSWVKTLKEQKASFQVTHSKYSTSLILPDGSKVNFILNKYRDKVFIANKMVLKDLKQHPEYELIKNREHSKKNFHIVNGIGSCSYPEVINIDISSAYATTMFINGLVTEKTFSVLQSLEKHERLPVMGMLAKRSLVYNYEDGECTSTKLSLGENRQIFFHLIQKVEDTMQKCKEIAGDNYLFHWVDGVFIKNDIPVTDLQKIERLLSDMGYKYKYEKVINFDLKRQKSILTIQMTKNGEFKEYKFNDPNQQENFESLVRCLQDLELHQGEDTLRQNVPTSPMLERPQGDGRLDYGTFLAVT